MMKDELECYVVIRSTGKIEMDISFVKYLEFIYREIYIDLHDAFHFIHCICKSNINKCIIEFYSEKCQTKMVLYIENKR